MAAKKKAKKNPFAKTPNKRMVVVTDYSRVRHIGTTVKYPKPLCGASTGFYAGFYASKSAKKNELPLCKRCISVVLKAYNDLINDPAYVEANTTPEQKEQKLKATQDGILALLKEYEDAS